ncbi:MAG: hypothetical protein ACUVSU_04535 [Aggregatilineaceae bacterium]
MYQRQAQRVGVRQLNRTLRHVVGQFERGLRQAARLGGWLQIFVLRLDHELMANAFGHGRFSSFGGKRTSG